MCSETKQKIASGLRHLMQQKPLSKITVSDLMDYTKMRRQSFYYHFQSIFDVLNWYCDQSLRQHLRFSSGEDFRSSITKFQAILIADRVFYKRVLEVVERQCVIKFCDPIIRPHIMHLVFGEGFLEPLSPEQNAAVDVLIRWVVYYLIDFVEDRKKYNAEQTAAEVDCLLEFMGFIPSKHRVTGHARSETARLVG